MRDDPLTSCPECGSKCFERQISGGAGVIFKGSGFYETDYNRSQDYQQSAKSEREGAKGGKQDAGKADQAPSGGKRDQGSAGKATGDGGASKSEKASD